MEILKSSQIKDDKYFKCWHCGAIFKANKEEYWLNFTITCEKEFLCTCPECGTWAKEVNYEEIKEEIE